MRGKFHKIVIVVNLLIAIVGLVLWWILVRGERRDFSKFNEYNKSRAILSQVEPVPLENGPSVAKNAEKKAASGQGNGRNDYLKAQLDQIKKVNEQCQLTIRELFPDFKQIDVNHRMYRSPRTLVELLKAAVGQSFAKSDFLLWREFERLLDGRENYSVAWANQIFAGTDSCREQKVIDFLSTALEGARKYRYSKIEVDNMLKALFFGLLEHQNGFFTFNDLIFFVGLLRQAMAQGLIGHEHRSHLDLLMERGMDEKNEFVRILEETENEQSKRLAFRRYYYSVKDIGLDLAAFIRELFPETE